MHSSRIRTTRSSGRWGGLHQAPPPEGPPGSRHPPRADTPPPGADTPRKQTPHQSRRPPGADTHPVNRMTDACENITLPQPRCLR